jgi:hypothetical protein
VPLQTNVEIEHFIANKSLNGSFDGKQTLANEISADKT